MVPRVVPGVRWLVARPLLRWFFLLTAGVWAFWPTLAQAQAQVQVQVQQAPRVALVIGNANYPEAPLPNAGNDARLMAKTLEGLGFSVIHLNNATKSKMDEAIMQLRAALQGRKAVGLLYYAGHALQLDWRNFLVPVDAALRRPRDVAAQTVDVQAVLDVFKSAGTQMNVVILDACRDNPFGSTGRGHGLAQMDAPPGTFLAYATAPGNVAEDGEQGSVHSTYTRNLVEQITRPKARIEDVFKRVRLIVRRDTKGQQIPWESTSLEDEFYFDRELPAAAPEPSKATLLAAERASWDKAVASAGVDAIRQHLLQYPSGTFSEVAHAEIEKRLAAIEGRPPGVTQLQVLMSVPDAQSRIGAELAGSPRLRPGWRVGELLVYAEQPQVGLFRFEREVRHRVLIVTNEQITTRNYDRFDLYFNRIGADEWQIASPMQLLAADYTVGKIWRNEYRKIYKSGQVLAEVQATSRVLSRERLKVPAGEFEVFRVEIEGTESAPGLLTNFSQRWWIDAASNKPVQYELRESRGDRVLRHDVGQLVAFEAEGSPAKD